MGIVRTGGDGDKILNPSEYRNEEELHDYLAQFPNLLTVPGDPDNILVRKKLSLPRAGELDLLLVDRDGLPIVVEVKLAKNREARRVVVGQVIDYVSDITSMTVDELDEAVEGALSQALTTLSGDAQGDEYQRRWKAVGSNLRAGLVRYIVVVDEVPDDLERIVRFLVLHSNLDIRLVRVQQYKDANDQKILVPFNVIDVRGMDRPDDVCRVEPSPELLAVLDAYARVCDPRFVPTGKAAAFRKLKTAGWPTGIHYEILKSGDMISADVHLESKELLPIVPSLMQLVETLKETLPPNTIWDGSWCRGKGRISCPFSIETPPDQIASAMCRLIEATHDSIDSMLSKK